MRFMLMRKADADTEAEVMPSEPSLQAMADFNQRLLEAGVLIGGHGLRPSREGFRIDFSNGEPEVKAGPFEDQGELLAGYTMLEVQSPEEAIAWAVQWPREDGPARLELRRLFELEDFAAGPAIDQHRAMGSELKRLPTGMSVYLWFSGNCREAMRFYQEVLGAGKLELMTYGDHPEGASMPGCSPDQVMHASINLGGQFLMGSDVPAKSFRAPQGVDIHLEYRDPDRAEAVFDRLCEGGSMKMPFVQTFWAYRFGALTDRFGHGWMISSEKPLAH